MKKSMLILVLLPLLVIALGGVSQAWQGRMAGMGDPYGLLADESDFLIHPAKIAKGEGVRFYGYYRFTYTDVTDWDIDYARYGSLAKASNLPGDELGHDALAGAAFPLGPGRMGIFFTYEGRRDSFDGYVDDTANFLDEFKSDLDAFGLRFQYGLPVGGFRLGGEVGLAYRQEANEFDLYIPTLGLMNYRLLYLIPGDPLLGLLTPPVVPYDSAYWEIPFKAGVEGSVGPLDVEFTLRGGVIVSGDNTFAVEAVSPAGANGFDLDGDVQGWRIGGDLWVRYLLGDGLSLPFLARVDYQEKTRDGDGFYFNNPAVVLDYSNEETSLHLVVGGGLDKELAKGTRIAAGLYYAYLHDTGDCPFTFFDNGVLDDAEDYSDYPDFSEHRIIVHLAGEHAFSTAVALRMGLEFFYGWPTQNLGWWGSDNVPLGRTIEDLSLEDSHWGIGASLGGSVQFNSFTLEPFINAGYQSLDLLGDGSFYYQYNTGVILWSYPDARDETRSEWSIGGGCAFLFDMP